MQIRTANANDAKLIGELLGRAYPALMAASYNANVLAVALPAMIKANPELLASGTFYVAEDGGRIIGCGGWTFEKPGSRALQDELAHLRHFATDPDMTRKGIGRSIFKRCADIATERGARRFQAFAGLNAESFYRSLGLKRLELIDTLIGRDVKLPTVLMEGAISTEQR